MKIRKLSKDDFIETKWGGGTTAQILIWPENADFKELKFDWRISYATLEQDSSVFTLFPGYHRILYLLEGRSALQFRNHGEKGMKPGDQVWFPGEWEVHSQGQASDLNVIMRQGVCGGIRLVCVKDQMRWERPVLHSRPEGGCTYVLYVINGGISVNDQLVHTGEVVIIQADASDDFLKAELYAEASGCKVAECVMCW